MENSNPISKIINDIIVLAIDPDLYMYINFVHMQNYCTKSWGSLDRPGSKHHQIMSQLYHLTLFCRLATVSFNCCSSSMTDDMRTERRSRSDVVSELY